MMPYLWFLDAAHQVIHGQMLVTGEIDVYTVGHTEIYVEFRYQRSCVCQKEMLHQHTLSWQWWETGDDVRMASRNFSTNSHRSLTMQYDLPWHVLPMINVTHVFWNHLWVMGWYKDIELNMFPKEIFAVISQYISVDKGRVYWEYVEFT